jgi:hypothetical protein
MNSNKLNHVHVYLIGGVVMIIIAAGLYFALIRPLKLANTELAQQVQTAETTTKSVDGKNFVYNQLTEAQAALQGAEARYQRKQGELASLESSYQLPPGQRIVLPAQEQQLLTQTLQPWLLLPQVVIQRMQAFSRAHAKRHGVTVQTQFAAPAPSTDTRLIPRSIIAWNLGPMVAEGPYEKVMAWARGWNDAPLLVAVDGLRMSLAGKGGKVRATCNLTVYIFPTGPGVQAVTGGTGAGTGGMGGMMGGMGGNGPGMMMSDPAAATAGNSPGGMGNTVQ